MLPNQSSSRNRATHFLPCLAATAILAGSGAPAARAQPAHPGPIEAPGEVVVLEQWPYYAKITGFVKTVAVDMGDRVKRGDLLATLDVPEMEQDVKKAKALVVKARTDIARAKLALKVTALTLERANAEVMEAEARQKESVADLERWKAEFEHAEKLLKRGVYDEACLDCPRNQLKHAEADALQAEAKVKSAEAIRDEAAAQRKKAKADMDSAEVNFRLADSAVDYASALMQYAEVRAVFDGVVVQRNVSAGALARPSRNGKGEPMFTVARRDRVRIIVHVPEKEAVRVRVIKGDTATIRFPALVGQDFTGAVAQITSEPDEKKPTYLVQIDLDNPDDKLRPGMLGTVVLTPKK
jgi:HlyD family secretion protein